MEKQNGLNHDHVLDLELDSLQSTRKQGRLGPGFTRHNLSEQTALSR